MATRRSWVTLAAILGPCAVVLLGFARPAHATASGDCSLVATFPSGATAAGPLAVDPSTVGDGAVAIPRSDTIEWHASVPGTAAERQITGSVKLELPWPLTSWTFRSWTVRSAAATAIGERHYRVPSIVPPGVKLTLAGTYEEPTRTCRGQIRVKVRGGSVTAPLTWVALAGTLLAFVAFVAVGHPPRVRLSDELRWDITEDRQL